uniref:Putative conserved secreted protein n=1 Tax=Aedes albopictus TaxID=7160 RepID=A0A1W7R749_AEDAL
MKQFISVLVVVGLLAVGSAHSSGKDAAAKGNGNAGAYEEIRVESSLNVRKTNQAVRRHVRSVLDILVPDHARVKRQFGAFPNSGFGSSSAQANANAFNQQFGPNGFGASAANAGAQSFFSQGPGGGFGASAANSASQGFQAGPGGITGSAGQSGSQTYHLPGNRDVSLAYTGGFSVADGKPSVSQGNSISFSG